MVVAKLLPIYASKIERQKYSDSLALPNAAKFATPFAATFGFAKVLRKTN
jgi:hypothetical protein